MNKRIRESILNLMQKLPLKEYKTSDIVEYVFKNQAEAINKELNSIINDSKKKKEAKRMKNRLHKNILYYLNKLVDEKYIVVSRIGENGEKYFAAIVYSQDDMDVSEANIPVLRLKSLAKKDAIDVIDAEDIYKRVNSIIVLSEKFTSLDSLAKTIESFLFFVTDTILINNYEHWINEEKSERVVASIVRILNYSNDKIINISINLNNIVNFLALFDFLKSISSIKNDGINIILGYSKKIIDKDIIDPIIEIFEKYNQSFYMHLVDDYKSPLYEGSYGIYSTDQSKWRLFYKNLPPLLVHSFVTTFVDIDKYRNLSELNSDILHIADSYLKINLYQYYMQRKEFEEILRINYPNAISTNLISTNYIRLISKEHKTKLVEELSRDIKRYVSVEKAIYKSCGIPLSFDINIYLKNEVNMIVNGFSIESSIFSDCIKCPVRISHKSRVKPRDIVKLLKNLILEHELPFFKYTFTKSKDRIMRLTDYDI